MNRLFLTLFFSFLSINLSAQLDSQPSVSTSTTGGRFEILQSPIYSTLLFRLDKYTGDVYIAKFDIGDLKWEKMPIPGLKLYSKYDKKNTINYQLYLSGSTVVNSFLLNIHNGVTFRLCHDSSVDTWFWSLSTLSYVYEPENKE